jgi:hypothetical protein
MEQVLNTYYCSFCEKVSAAWSPHGILQRSRQFAPQGVLEVKLKAFYNFIEGLKLGIKFQSDFKTAQMLQAEYPHETLGYIFHNVVRKDAKVS